MNSQRFASILLGLAVVLGLLSALDVVAPDTGDTSTLTTAEAARSGAWTCSAPGLALGQEVAVIASGAPAGLQQAVDPEPVATPSPSDAPGGVGVPSEVTIDRYGGGKVARIGRTAPFAEQSTETTVLRTDLTSAEAELGVSARWRRQPAAVARVWERSSEFGPAGLLAAPCVPGSSATWVLPGLSTAGGAEATIVLSNPFASDASVTLTLATETGPEQPSLLENVVVPAQSVRLLPLNEHAPERRDLGVVVTTRSGRVVVEALQSVNAAIGGIEGVTIVRAAPGGAPTWTIPWVPTTPAAPTDESTEPAAVEDAANTAPTVESTASPDDAAAAGPDTSVVQDDRLDGDTSSWIWVTNVDVDDAILLVTVHGPRGGELMDLEALDPLPPGAIRRIDLDGLTRDRRSAVTVATENGAAIVAAAGTQVASSNESRTGIAVQLGAPASDQVWVLPGAGPEGRHEVLSLVNPGGEMAVVAVSLWGADGIVRPASAQLVEVPPGTIRMVDVAAVLDPAIGSSVLFVQAVTGELVAGRVGFSQDERLDLIVNVGSPSAVWRGGTLVPVTRYDPYLTGEVSPSAAPGEPTEN